MKVSTEIGLIPGHVVLDGDQLSLPKRGTALQLLAHVCCGQTARWIKMPFGTEVGLGPGDIVLDVDTARPRSQKKQRRGHSTPNFGSSLLWSNGWMD